MSQQLTKHPSLLHTACSQPFSCRLTPIINILHCSHTMRNYCLQRNCNATCPSATIHHSIDTSTPTQKHHRSSVSTLLHHTTHKYMSLGTLRSNIIPCYGRCRHSPHLIIVHPTLKGTSSHSNHS